LTQTIPGDGGGWYCAGAELVDFEADELFAGAGAGALDDAGALEPAVDLEEAGAPGGTGAGDEALRPLDTVTIGEIFVIVPCETPARERSATDE
jgi:hypothetical protein